jgi:phasin family protein
MFAQIQEFVALRGDLLRGQVRQLRESSSGSVQTAFFGSAEALKGLKSPVRALARSGVKLSAVSQETAQNLIELQSEAVTAALSEAAQRLERAAKAASLVELVRGQIELMPKTRERIVGDANRTVAILRSAGRDLRSVAQTAYAGIVEKEKAASTASAATARRKTARRGRPRKTATRARKARA